MAYQAIPDCDLNHARLSSPASRLIARFSIAQTTGANMSNADGGPPPRGGWFKSVLAKAEGEYSFLKSLTVLSLFGTLIGAYFQNLSAYENKVTAQAQADMAAATQTFTDTSSALAASLNLQQRLITSYHNAVAADTDAEATSFETMNARETYKSYATAYAEHVTTTSLSISTAADGCPNGCSYPASLTSP